jgi:alkylhydroperoxidase family enzyme
VTLDDELVRALEQDYTQAPITKADRAMLDYVVQLTKDATQIGPRSEGFDDRAILQITLIASWFNYINRVADALGVGRESASGASASTK